MTNWFSIHRSIKNHWLFKEKRTFSKFEAWIFIIMEANHSPGKHPVGNQIVDIERGQIFTSKLKLSEIFGWSRKKLDGFLRALEGDNMVHIKSTTKYTLITVVKYDFYQSDKGRKIQQLHNESTTGEQQLHNNGTSAAQQLHTTNKKEELNNNNNENKKEYKDDALFEKWWKIYPKKTGSKQKIKSKFNKAIKEVGEDQFFAATEIYLKTQDQIQFIRGPEVFINQEGYSKDNMETYQKIIDEKNDTSIKTPQYGTPNSQEQKDAYSHFDF